MFRDYPATFRTEEYIAAHARKVRTSLGIDHQTKMVLHQVVDQLQHRQIGEKGKFEVVIFEAEPGYPQAFVSFDPPTMHLDKEIWEFAKYEDPFSNFVISHELGHLFLHKHDAKAFSAKGEIKSIYGQDERSAEWQANMFAYHFLAPTHVISTMGAWRDVKDKCNLNEEVAIDRFNAVSRLVTPNASFLEQRLDIRAIPAPNALTSRCCRMGRV